MRLAVFFVAAAALWAQDLSNSVTLIPKADDSATGILAFREKKANGVHAVGLRAPDSIASTLTWTLPSVDGTSGFCITTNGSATLSWAACGGWTRTPGGGVGGTDIIIPNTSTDDVGVANIYPIATATYGLGLSSRRWNSIYGVAGDLSGTLAVSGDATFGGDILLSTNETKNLGAAANKLNNLFTRRWEVSDGTYARVLANSPGAGSNTGTAFSVSNASNALQFYVTYAGTTQAVNLAASGTLTVSGNATFSGHILNDTAGTKDIGASSNTFQTLYVENVDAAPSGQTGNYINTRKLNVMDGSGGTSFWDVQANATVANADNYKIRDKGGVVRFELVNQEEVTWSALSEGRMNLHWVPYATATWDLGKAGGLWRDLYLSRNAAVGGDATITGMVKVDVIRPDADSQTTVRTLYPEAADTYGLGTWVNRFLLVAASQVTTNRINFGSGGTIDLYGNLRPLTDDSFSLGEASYRYTKAWVKDLDISGTCNGCGGFWTRTVGGGVGGTNIISQATAADEIVSSANVYPSADNSKSLGLSSRKWSDVHSVFGTFSSNVSVGGTFSVTSTSTLTGNATFAGDILANANESKNVGSTTNRFNAVYSRRFEAYDGTYSRIVLNNPGSGSNTGNALAILSASGGSVLYVSYGGTTQAVALAASSSLAVTGTSTVRDVVPETNNTYALGASGSSRFSKLWVTDVDISGICTGCSGIPVADSTAIIKGSADATKLLRFEVDGFTAATTRVLTPQNADYTIAGTNIANTFSAAQTINANLTTQDIIESSNEAHNIGSTSSRFNVVYSRRFEAYDGTYSRIVLNNPGSGSNTGNALSILNASGSNVLYVSFGGTTQAVNLAASGTLSVTGSSSITNNLTIGNSGSDHRFFAASQTAAIRTQVFSYDGYDTTGAGFVGTNTNHQLIFRTNDLDRGRILAAGAWEIYYNATFYEDILSNSDEVKNIGSTAKRFNAVYSRRFEAYDGTYSRIVLNNPGNGSNTGNAIALNNASGTSVFYVSYGGTTQAVNLAASGTLNVTGTATLGNVTLGGNVSFAVHNAYSIGASGTRAAAIYGVAVDGTTVTAGTLSATSVSSSLTPSSDSGGNLGSQSVNWNYVYADGTFYIIYGASSIRHEFGQNGITLRTTGLATTLTATASSGNLVAGTITSGTTTTGGVYLISDGSVTYSGIGTTGTPTTLNVRKSDDSGGCTITVRGGIITASTC